MSTTNTPMVVTRPRLVVLTDISTMTNERGEPDDTQSMIRLMLYSNDFDIQGLIATSNMRHGRTCHPDYIERVIKAYGKVQKNLAKHDSRYPQAKQLLSVVRAGNPLAGLDQVGPGKDTPGSQRIIKLGDMADPRPLWITVWGGTTDLAQALWTVREERGEAGVRQFVRRLRVHAIADQDDTGPWIREQFPRLFYITSYHAFRGMYRAGEASLRDADWVERHVRQDHGFLGSIYPNYDGGDPWGKVRGVKEGDTPSYLYLLPTGLSDSEEPAWGSWGGRFKRSGGKHYVDGVDTIGSESSEALTVSRWRRAFQNDFASRLAWCVADPSVCNHPPVVVIDGPQERSVTFGESVELDASKSFDPDGHELGYHWWVYPEASGIDMPIEIDNADRPVAVLRIPENGPVGKLHIIVSVTDGGEPSLTRYERLILRVYPD